MVVRRLQRVGASTFTVALPKEWVKARGLGAKSEVDVQVLDDGNIRISTINSEKRKEREILIKEKETDAGFLIRKIMAAYIAGYDVIKLDLLEVGPEFEVRDKLRKIIKNKMAGGEIVDESINSMTIQVILRPYEYPINKILMRMTSMVHNMILDVCKALASKNKNILLDVVERDDDIDKLYFMGSRWLSSIIEDKLSALDYDIKMGREVLEYRIIFRHVERVADHVCKISTILLDLIDKIDNNSTLVIKELLEKTGTIFVKSLNCLKSNNLLDANRVIHDARSTVKSIEEVLEKFGHSSSKEVLGTLAVIFDSTKRIAEYGIGISEIVFNISIN
ncbi:MAG: phosphate uptake regulator PhoU [Candidatus Methanomethylicaceae archaeon]|nr:phosphate uptake regulator PhoU [Candidatus Verstraetearchaeota archaeon]